MKHKILILCGLVILAAPALALEVVVPSAEAPTIADALAIDGVTVVTVAPGVYYESGLVVRADVILQGQSGVAADVVIDAQGADRVLHVLPGNGTELRHLTLRNGRKYDDRGRGGGILAEQNWLTIDDVHVTACEAASGGGVYIQGGGVTRLSGLVIDHCQALVAGGGLFLNLWLGYTHAEEITLANNSAGQMGGGLYVVKAQEQTVLTRATIAANSAPYGAGFAAWQTSAPVLGVLELQNVLVTLNQGDAAMRSQHYAAPALSCSDAALNSGGDWAGVFADQLGADGNISADPQLCDPVSGAWTVADGSPCAPDGACGGIGAWGVGCETVGNEPDDGVAPAPLVAFGAHPNPFNPETEIDFSMAAPGRMSLAVYDLSGRRVRTLVDGALPVGNHHAVWRGDDDSGRAVASGVYLAVIRGDGRREALRLALVK